MAHSRIGGDRPLPLDATERCAEMSALVRRLMSNIESSSVELIVAMIGNGKHRNSWIMCLLYYDNRILWRTKRNLNSFRFNWQNDKPLRQKLYMTEKLETEYLLSPEKSSCTCDFILLCSMQKFNTTISTRTNAMNVRCSQSPRINLKARKRTIAWFARVIPSWFLDHSRVMCKRFLPSLSLNHGEHHPCKVTATSHTIH